MNNPIIDSYDIMLFISTRMNLAIKSYTQI
jgi:hypothetical protein